MRKSRRLGGSLDITTENLHVGIQESVSPSRIIAARGLKERPVEEIIDYERLNHLALLNYKSPFNQYLDKMKTMNEQLLKEEKVILKEIPQQAGGTGANNTDIFAATLGEPKMRSLNASSNSISITNVEKDLSKTFVKGGKKFDESFK